MEGLPPEELLIETLPVTLLHQNRLLASADALELDLPKKYQTVSSSSPDVREKVAGLASVIPPFAGSGCHRESRPHHILCVHHHANRRLRNVVRRGGRQELPSVAGFTSDPSATPLGYW